VATPETTLRQAAAIMKESDTGVLPVGEHDKLVGMITDRDIAVRAVAEGKGPDAPVREVMTAEVKYCFEDEDTAHVAETMAQQQVRRLPVVNRDKRLVGIVSLGDLATEDRGEAAQAALRGVSQPGGRHNQSEAADAGAGAGAAAYAGSKPTGGP
jgi:CBS-domain-containing membrane protein